MFVGRKKELTKLRNRFRSKENELIVVDGRLRVGKTTLIEEAFDREFFFRHLGVSPKRMLETKGRKLNVQLRAFALSFRLYFGQTIKTPTSWLEAFALLIEKIRADGGKTRKVIFFDEIPWMDTPRSLFLESFGWFINNIMESDANVLIVVAGSSTSWMIDNIVADSGGLYDRATLRLHLQPFQLFEAESLLRSCGMGNLPRLRIAAAYMCLGGIPFYLKQFDADMSFAENIDAIFFGKSPKLEGEFASLFSSMFDASSLCESIVRVLSTSEQGMTREELLFAVALKDGDRFSKALRALEFGSFVLRYTPYGQKKNIPYYKLIDPYCLFYLREVEGRVSLNGNVWEDEVSMGEENEWKGRAFENLVFVHLDQVKAALGISGIETMQFSWFIAEEKSKKTQVDLVIERKDGIINLCEMKYRSGIFSVSYDYHCVLEKRKAIFAKETKPDVQVVPTLITTIGLSRGEYADDFRKAVTLDALFAPAGI